MTKGSRDGFTLVELANVFEGGQRPGARQGLNVDYFGISAVSSVAEWIYSSPGLTVQQAYAIDNKVDDGLPTHGRIIAAYLNLAPYWANGDWYPFLGSPGWSGWQGDYTANSPSATSCYDNGGTGQTLNHYTLTQNNGNGVNCALSFRFQ